MDWTCSCSTQNSETAHFCASCGAPNPAASAGDQPAASPPEAGDRSAIPQPGSVPPPPPKKKAKTAVIVLVVLAVLLIPCLVVTGIIAAIAIPNLLSAIERSKQKRAVSEIRSIATAIQSYYTDNNAYPDTGHNEAFTYTVADVEQLAPMLVPDYIATLPAKDPYDKPYQYGVSLDNQAFILTCSGSDGVSEISEIPSEPVQTSCYEDDIIWENDELLQYPEGKQKKCK